MSRRKPAPVTVVRKPAPVTVVRNDSNNPTELRASRHARQRIDTWYNSRSKFGSVTRDPVLVSRFLYNRERIKRAEAEALYEFDWLAARVVEQMAHDATREWIRFTHSTDPDKAEKLRQEDQRLGGQAAFKEAIRLSRLHGGNIMVVGAWDGGHTAPEEPVEIKRVQRVAWTANVDRWLAFPQTWYRDQEDPKYGLPETYTIHRLAVVGSAVSVVHESRTIRFDGNPLPPLAKVRNWNWGASVLDRVYDALRNWGISNQAAASVIPSFITYALKIENLQQLIANGDFATISNRVGEAFGQMATQNLMTYGTGEEIQKMGTPISGLPDLLDRFMNIVAGACNIPKSILFQSESGSLGGNAAQSDRDNWFDSVASYQETYLRQRVRYWLDMIGMGVGLKPGEVEFEFVSLKQLSEQQQSELYFKNAQADQTYINSQVVHPEHVAIHRFSGQKYNPSPLVFDTEREEKIVEMLNKQPVDMGMQDQMRVPFSGDVEPPPGGPDGDGGGGFPGGGPPGRDTEEGPGAQAESSRDSLDGDVGKTDDRDDDKTDLEWYADELKHLDNRVKPPNDGGVPDEDLAVNGGEPPHTPTFPKMRVVARRADDGSLHAMVEPLPEVHQDVANPKKVLHPGSRGGHIIGYDHHGNPIYGKHGVKPPPGVTEHPPLQPHAIAYAGLGTVQLQPEQKGAGHVMYEKIGEAKGTNPGGLFKGSDGVNRYVKHYKDPAQSYSEDLANRVYRALGIGAPAGYLVHDTDPNDPDKISFASRYIGNSKPLKAVELNEHRAKTILRGFAADVLLANWDAVGLNHDNILVTSEGGGHSRIDNGGSLLFRAKAGRKSESELNSVTEWDSMSDPKKNLAYSKIFAAAGIKHADELGPDALNQIHSIGLLREKTDDFADLFASTPSQVKFDDVAKMREMMSARADYLSNVVAPRIEEQIKTGGKGGAGFTHAAAVIGGKTSHGGGAHAGTETPPHGIKSGTLPHSIWMLAGKNPDGISITDMHKELGGETSGKYYIAANKMLKDGHLIKVGKKYVLKGVGSDAPGSKPPLPQMSDLAAFQKIGGLIGTYEEVKNNIAPHYSNAEWIKWVVEVYTPAFDALKKIEPASVAGGEASLTLVATTQAAHEHAQMRLANIKQKYPSSWNSFMAIDNRTNATTDPVKLAAWYTVLKTEGYTGQAQNALDKLQGLGYTVGGAQQVTPPSVVQPAAPKPAGPPPLDPQAAARKKAAIEAALAVGLSGAPTAKAKKVVPYSHKKVEFYEHENGLSVKPELHTQEQMKTVLDALVPDPLPEEERSSLLAASAAWASSVSGPGVSTIGKWKGSANSLNASWYKGDVDGMFDFVPMFNAIKNAPKWTGPMYRGMRMSTWNYKKWMRAAEEDGVLRLDAPQGFSRNYNTASIFSGGPQRMILIVDRAKTARMIEDVEELKSETEMIALPNTHYKVNHYEEFLDSKGKVTTHLYLTEK